MFEQAFKNVDDVLRKESGCTTELAYTEQTPRVANGDATAWCPALAALGDSR